MPVLQSLLTFYGLDIKGTVYDRDVGQDRDIGHVTGYAQMEKSLEKSNIILTQMLSTSCTIISRSGRVIRTYDKDWEGSWGVYNGCSFCSMDINATTD